MSVPAMMASMSAAASMAAARPTDGMPPAPRPRAEFCPNCTVRSASEADSAWGGRGWGVRVGEGGCMNKELCARTCKAQLHRRR
eukprot:scaffold19075_cov104-Isochrysis_galbana.AAC.1